MISTSPTDAKGASGTKMYGPLVCFGTACLIRLGALVAYKGVCQFEAAYLYKGYIKYLFLLRWVTRTEILAAVAHVAIVSTVAPLAFLIARRLRLSERVAGTAGMAVAWLPYYAICVLLQPQVAFTAAVSALSIWIFLVWRDRAYDLGFGILYALVWSYFAYCRPNAAILIPFTFAIYVAEQYLARPRQSRLPAWSTSGIVAFLIVLAFYGMAMENYQVYHRQRPFAPTFGYNLYLGNNEHVRDDLARDDVDDLEAGSRSHGDLDFPNVSFYNELEAKAKAHAGLPAVPFYGFEEDDQLASRAKRFMASHPAETLHNSVVKAFRYWGLRLHHTQPLSGAKNIFYVLPYLIYGPLALLGIFCLTLRKRYFALLITVGIILTYWASHFVFFSMIRFRMTTEYLVLILAAEGFWYLFRRKSGDFAG